MSVPPPKPRRRPRARARPDVAVKGTESIDVRTSDGWSLRADVHEPGGAPVGVAVLAHAMMARRSEFERPRGAGLASRLVARGWRVVAFDFRGHGDSTAPAREGGTYGYDDLVAKDLPAVHEFVRSRLRRKAPVVLVGHSLGGHVGLASQGTGLVSFDAVVCVGANVWLRDLEPLRPRWLVKRATLAAILAVSRRVGRFPARLLRLGSDDESRAYFEDFERFARTGGWTSADGGVDYLAALGAVRVPVLQLVSDGDRLACAPECGARFVARCGGEHEVIRVEAGDDGGPPPDHMGMVTSGRIGRVWERIEAWMRARLVAS
ncbi:MAG TPA: alpha/beta fold hydrolase [Polyangiaceae bacterium]|jgi:predicted alpha/beta hydrolase